MSSSSLQQSQPSNIADEAIKALSLLPLEEQHAVLEYINALVDSTNEQQDSTD
jgi:hypothetical protein